MNTISHDQLCPDAQVRAVAESGAGQRKVPEDRQALVGDLRLLLDQPAQDPPMPTPAPADGNVRSRSPSALDLYGAAPRASAETGNPSRTGAEDQVLF